MAVRQNNHGKSPKPSDATSSPIYNSEETFVACNSQGDSSHPIVQTSDGNVSLPCDKNNITEVEQLPKCGAKEKKRATVREIYICSICEKEFRQSGNFQKHMKSHTESHHYCKCGNCGSEFDDDEKLLQHMQKEHTGSNPYKCELCAREFRQYNNLRRHLRSHREKTFVCVLCGKKCNENYYLQMHMGSHTGNRKFGCGVCGTKFMSNRDLEKHVNTHPKSELYVCDVCGKAFSKACVLRQHKKKHTGNRPYQCLYCEKNYAYRHHLVTHMKSHTKTKPFICNICGKEFSQISHLNKHKQKHLTEAKLSNSTSEDSNDRYEKVIIPLGGNSIPDELNGKPSNLERNPRCKRGKKKPRGARKKVVSTASSMDLHHAVHSSEANPYPYDSQTSHLNKHHQQHLIEANLSDSSPAESHGGEEKAMNTLGNNGILDELNVVPSKLQQKPKAKPVRKRSRGPRKKAVSTNSSAYLHHASQISEANPNPYDSSDPGMFGPLSNGSAQNVMEQMNLKLPGHPIHQNQVYMSFSPSSLAAYSMNLYMMNYQSHSGNGFENDYVQANFFQNRNPVSYESPKPLSHTRDFSPTVNSARSTPVSSAFIYKECNQYFQNSPFAKPVEFLNCNMPVAVNGHFDFPLHTTQKRGNMDFEKGKEMLNCLDLSRSTAMQDRKCENYRKMKVKDEKLNEVKDQAYAEGKPFEANAFQAEKFSCLKQQIEVREMIKHTIKKETTDAMIVDDEEEGRLIIVEEDAEIQAHNSKISNAEMAELEKRCSVVCQNEKTFSQRMHHDLKNTFKRDTLQRSQIGSICCNKSVVSGDCNDGSNEEKEIQQVSTDLRWVNNVETSRSHSTVQINGPFNILQTTATLPYQRAVNDCNDSSGIVLDMSLKRSPTEHRQPRGEISTCPACLAPMNTDSDLFEHLVASIQCYQLYIAKKLHKSASSPSEEPCLKLAKKYACQEMQDEEIYVSHSQSDPEEPLDLTKPSLRWSESS